eukprot:SAG22_NODE_16214_length_330_cov_1.562771_1_plen_81_part_10
MELAWEFRTVYNCSSSCDLTHSVLAATSALQTRTRLSLWVASPRMTLAAWTRFVSRQRRCELQYGDRLPPSYLQQGSWSAS